MRVRDSRLPMSYRIGVDIGGTFTDLVLVDDAGTVFEVVKVLTTSTDPARAAGEGIEALLSATGVPAEEISHVVHGTTLFANALIERKGARTALITTAGFRDALEIAREHRYDMYDLRLERAAPLVPRYLRYEVDERVLEDGSVHRALDLDGAARVVDELRAQSVEAVAVCLLHGYANSDHERAIGQLLRERAPEIACSLSCDVAPEIREYERTSTTVANVFIQRLAESYLNRLVERLRELGIVGTLFVMQSNGGICTVDLACRLPIHIVESGPAAGALAAAYYGERMGQPDLLSFDMGGTTAKAGVIEAGEPLITREFEVARVYLFKRGSGLPIKAPVIEMIEIGAGGGSIARLSSLGLLAVGPDSAGSDPGPACYGRGGTAPTVTDADLVLGYLDPDFFLGGAMTLDRAAAHDAIAAHVAEPLDLDPLRAAWGIHQVVNESMAAAARMHAVERGKDLRRFPLFAFGGAGPVHADRVARILGCPRFVCPRGAGVTSAVGFLAAPLSTESVRTLPGKLAALDWSAVTDCLAEMEHEGRSVLEATLPAEQISVRRWADLRYSLQGHEMRIPVPGDNLGHASEPEIRAAFETEYESIYGRTPPGPEIEVVSWRVSCVGPLPELHLPEAPTDAVDQPGSSAQAVSPIKGHRPIYLPEESGLLSVPVYDRYALAVGARFDGPAVVEERESTAVLGPDTRAHVDESLNLVVELS